MARYKIKGLPKAQQGLSYTEWQNLPPELQWDERYRSQLDPNVRALVDPEFQAEAINTGATGYIPIQFTDGQAEIVGDRRGGKKVSDPNQMRAGIEAFPINYEEEWAKAPGTFNQYMEPVTTSSKADDFTKQILWQIPEDQRRDVVMKLHDLEEAYKSDQGVKEAIDRGNFSKDGKFDRSAAYSLLERNPELAQNALSKFRGQQAEKFGTMKEATGEGAEQWLYDPNATGIAAIDDMALPMVQAVGRSITDLYNDPGAVANIPEAYKAYAQYWAPEQFGERAIDYTADQEALQGTKAAGDLLNVLPANLAKSALAAKAWQAGRPLASRAWQTYRPVTDISHLNPYNLKRQLGDPLTQSGSFNQGIYGLKKFPENVVKFEDPNWVAKYQQMPHYPDVNWVEKTSVLPENFPGVKVQSQLRNIKGMKPETQALIMNRVPGTPIEKMDPDALLNIPLTSYRDAYENMLKLRDETLGMDYEGRGNFMYDPSTQQFQFLDYVPHDPLTGVPRDSKFYFWQDKIFGGGNPFMYGTQQSGKNIRNAFEAKLLNSMYDAAFNEMDADFLAKQFGDRIRRGIETPSPSQPTKSFADSPVRKPLSNIFKVAAETMNPSNVLPGKGTKAKIKEGNEWLQNWIQHPATKNKIDRFVVDQFQKEIDYQKALPLMGYSDDVIKQELDASNQRILRAKDMGNISKKYEPHVTTYPLTKQVADLVTNKPNVHLDNYGVSYRHNLPFDAPERNAIPKIWPSQESGTWVSRSMPDWRKPYIAVHEGTHDWVTDDLLRETGQFGLIQDALKPEMVKAYDKWVQGDRADYNEGYLADPTEVHARTMELRKWLGVDPSYKIDAEDAEKVLEAIRKNDSPVDKKFGTLFKSPQAFADIFNNLWGAAPLVGVAGAAGAGALNQKRYGGPVKAQQGFSKDLLKTSFSRNLESGIPPAENLSFEAQIDKKLGNPQKKAYHMAEIYSDEGEDPIDNLRHPLAGMYTADALRDLGMPMASSIMSSGLLGLGHELTTLPMWKDSRPWQTKVLEAGEDVFNNMVGAGMSALPMPENAKFFALKYLSDNNMLPDGVVMPQGDLYVKENGGEVMELTEEEILRFRQGGYIVEEL